jgi:predicted transposase/invertase (TIGR01784 family)
MIEIPKIASSRENINDSLMEWLLFLENPENKNMEVLKMKNPQIEKAMTVLEFISSDKEARELYEAREKELRDKIGQIMFAKEEGFNEGIEKGKFQMVRNLYKMGLSLEQIAEASKISVENLRQILSIN